jgi:two-component system phosphate regulon sensor histidine kinase PhoR
MFEKNEIEIKKEWLNLHELVTEVLGSMRLQFDKCKAIVTLNTSGEKFDLKADRLHITSVIYNLLDNALKYSKGDIKININILAHQEYVALTIEDNGIGIGEEYNSKIFEQFFRVPSGDRHNIKGYGLGLSYVNHIVKIHKGLIEVNSEPGKGSSFTVKLPYDESSNFKYIKEK